MKRLPNFVLAAGAVLATGVGFAQQRAQLIGFVRDPGGGVVLDATVTVLNLDNGIRRVTRTNPQGMYALSSLKDGEYKTTVRSAGFRTIARQGIHLDSTQTMRLDFSLEIGRIEEVITVEGDGSAVDTNDGSAVTILDPQAARNLPLNNRGLQGLIEFAPGLIATPAASGESGQFTAGGQRTNTNYFTVDGVSANNGVSGAGLPGQFSGNSMPGMTAIGSLHGLAGIAEMQEVRVQTSTYSPEVGRLPGAQISVTTRSGSNDYHGEFFGALRNSSWNAGDWMANRAGLQAPPRNFRNAGGTVGGPLRRNRTFFLTSLEWLHLRESAAWRIATPSDLARSLAQPGARSILDLFPRPNGMALTALASEHTAQITWPAQVTMGAIRLDQALGDRGLLFSRVAISPSSNQFGYFQTAESRFRSTSVTVGSIYAFSSGITNDTRLNVSRMLAQSSWTSAIASLSGLSSFPAPVDPETGTVRAIAIGGMGQILSGSGGRNRQNQWNVLNTTAFTAGVHRLRFGVDYQRLMPSRDKAINAIVDVYPSLEDLVAGKPSVDHFTQSGSGSTLIETFSLFALDNWQITPSTNIMYGFRWELTPPPSFRSVGVDFGGSVTGVPMPGGPAQPTPAPAVPPNSKPAWQTRYTQFAPRIGVAHRLNRDGTLTLRAGAGLFYDLSFPSSIDLLNGSPYNRWRLVAADAPASPESVSGFAGNLKLPYSLQWSTALERRFADRTVISALYAGAAGRSLLRREGSMTPASEEPPAVIATNNGSSDYHSLQVQVRRPFGRTLQCTFAYSWSHSIDNGSWDSAVFLLYPGRPGVGDRGPSDFDIRHSVQVALLYRIPSRGADSKFADAFRDWTLSGMFRARTGFPIDIAGSENQFGLGFDNASRPNLAPGVPIWIADGAVPGGTRLNPLAFQTAPSGQQGTLGRNAIRGFGLAQVDLSLQREFAVAERMKFQVRMETYNVTNTTRFADPNRFLNGALFGQSASLLNLMMGTGRPSSGLTPAFQSGGPRTFQLSFRAQF